MNKFHYQLNIKYTENSRNHNLTCAIKADSDTEFVEKLNKHFAFNNFAKPHLSEPTTKFYLYKYENGRPRGQKLGNLNFRTIYGL